jgi:hypothetical protein
MMGHVICNRAGELSIARRAPKGTIKVMSGDGRRIRWILRKVAHQACQGAPLTIPGFIAAPTDVAAMHAVKAFEQVVLKALARKPSRKKDRLI